MKRILTIILVCNSIFTFAQDLHFVYEQGIEVVSNGKTLTNAWMGGFQAPQFNSIDVNGDGKQDLMIFDRTDNSTSVFLNINNEYKYAPDYQDLFPDKLFGWVLLRDYNCDGKMDIFTSNVSGISVFKNTSAGSNLSFESVNSFLGSDKGPIFIPSADMPSIEDIDFDGDVDILTFDVGGSYVEFYKNMQVENSLPCSNLTFKRETVCWGDFSEGGLNNTITLGDSCGGMIPFFGERPIDKDEEHVGSSLLAFDNDGDSDMDLLVGDISADNMQFLKNGQNASNSIITQLIDSFPTTNPINMYVFPAAYYVDVDFDGKRDLIAAPNEGAEVAGKNFNQIYFYKNTNTDANPTFSFQKNNFLLDKMIELGAGAIPAFLDYEGDGDYDLVVGNYAYRAGGTPSEITNKLAFFENIGTKTTPKFKLVDTDFANTSALGFYNTSPSFGDLDGDGDIDMLLGEYSGKFQYFINDAGAGNPCNFVFDSSNYGGLDVGSNSTPVLIDIDFDNDLDLISGEKNGNINLFENIGDSANPKFALVNDSVAKIEENSPLVNAGYTVPRIIDFDKDGKLDLVIGTFDGNIRFYSNLEDNLNSTVTEIENVNYKALTNSFSDVKYGRRSAPALADLNNDSLPDMIAGIFRGGLMYFKNESDSTISIEEDEKTEVQVYPNPSNSVFNIRTSSHQKLDFSVYNLVGEKIEEGNLTSSISTINLSTNPKGIYLLILRNQDKIVLKQKLLLLK